MASISYDQAREAIFARGTVADGYNGNRTECGFAFVHGVTLIVCSFGYFRSGIPICADATQARWHIENGETAKRLYQLEGATA
jgi:hypothetical protein